MKDGISVQKFDVKSQPSLIVDILYNALQINIYQTHNIHILM